MCVWWPELIVPYYLCTLSHGLYIISIKNLSIKNFNFKIQINMANKVVEQVMMFTSKPEFNS